MNCLNLDIFFLGRPESDPGPVGPDFETLGSKLVKYIGRVRVYYIKMGLSQKFSISTRTDLLTPLDPTIRLEIIPLDEIPGFGREYISLCTHTKTADKNEGH